MFLTVMGFGWTSSRDLLNVALTSAKSSGSTTWAPTENKSNSNQPWHFWGYNEVSDQSELTFFYFGILLKFIKIFSTHLWANVWYVRCSFLPNCRPIKSIKKWMTFNFFSTISAKSMLSFTNHSLQYICGCRWQVCFSWNNKCFFPM